MVSIAAAGGRDVTIRASISNIAATLAFGALFAFIGSIQQIVFDVFDARGYSASPSPASRDRWRPAPGSIHGW